jgi:hypothetical protein
VDAAKQLRTSRWSFFALAAWFSLLAPAATARLFYAGIRVRLVRTASAGTFFLLFAVFTLSFLAGWVSLFGLRGGRVLAIFPAAALGIVLSAVLAWFALWLGVLSASGLPPD